MSALLELDRVNVEYSRHGKTVHAVKEFSLSIASGESVGLVGESGSGKSTVALSILRLIRSQEGRILSGRILWKGRDLLTLSLDELNRIRRREMGMIFQDPFTALNPVMRIREQMKESYMPSSPTDSGGGSMDPRPETAGDDVLRRALEQVQLEAVRVLGSYPHQLSGGQRQRVLIAMALLNRPELVIADEPTTALDVIVQKEILDLLFHLQKELGMALLFISHNLGLVGQYTSRLVVMKQGEIVESGESRPLFQAPQHPYTLELIQALPRMTRGAAR